MPKPRKPSRAELAGAALGRAIIRAMHLMYQRNTARNFERGLRRELDRGTRLPTKRTGD